MRHDEVIRFRASADLRRELKAAADQHGETLSAYIRQAALAHARGRDPALDRQLLEELVELRQSIGRVGNNLNQVAKHLHGGGRVPAEYPDQLMAATEKMRDRVCAMLDQYRSGL